jgi:hypothetical protein
LCIEAEALQDSTEWKNITKEFIRLQEEWKKIGPVPLKLTEKIWKRFRTACDHYFNSKETYFAAITASEPENLKLKEQLIEELKNYSFSTEKTENLDKLKDFQRQWMEIGHVPVKEKERIQTAYRQALNEKMKQLNIASYEFSSNETHSYYKNSGAFSLQRSNDHSETGIKKEIGFLQGKIVAMQDEINLWENNIGFLARSKNADILKQEFEKKIQKSKNALELHIARLRFLREELAKESEKKPSNRK